MCVANGQLDRAPLSDQRTERLSYDRNVSFRLPGSRPDRRKLCVARAFVSSGSWADGRTGEMTTSDQLVPGDLVDIAHADLATFPADLILLAGDAIVNESMLTGESVPVSKTPIDSVEAVKAIEGVGGDVLPTLSRHVVFCGTRIVRIRRTPGLAGNEPEAVAMVLRTGALGGSLCIGR